MNKKDIIKLLKLLKKDKKKNKKLKKMSKLPKVYQNIASLTSPNISQVQYQPGFSIPKFNDINRIEAEQFSEFKKTRGLLPTESRSIVPSELDLYKEFGQIKKLSKADSQEFFTDKNIKSQALERQKYLDKLQIEEEKRLIKEQKALVNQQLKTKKKIEGIRSPTIDLNRILSPPITSGFSLTDNQGLETAIGGTSADFVEQLPPAEQKKEGSSLLSVGTSKKTRGRPKKSNNTI